MKEKYGEMFDKINLSYGKKVENIVKGLHDDRLDNCFWLCGPSGYVFKTNRAKWAIDPCIRTESMKKSSGKFISALSELDFIVLSHSHEDHFDRELVSLLADSQVNWYIPSFFSKSEIAKTGLHKDRITYIDNKDCFCEKGVDFNCFTSAHFGNDNGKIKGCDELGFLIKTAGKNILMPGDVRNYDFAFPSFERVDCMFAHVWLGYGKAKGLPDEEMLSAFTRFVCKFSPENVYLAHIYDKRPSDSLWTYSHAGICADEILCERPEINVMIPAVGQIVFL